MTFRVLLVGMLALAGTGCTTTKNEAAADFTPPQGNYRIIVMRPDIAVSVLTAGGTLEPREDWTNTARENVLNAIREQQLTRGGDSRIALDREDAGAPPETVLELERLHEAVGQSIQIHKYRPNAALPTKKNRFDWTLGELAIGYGKTSGYDYALFVFARDSFSSGGRQALQAVGFLGCVVGFCMLPAGGYQAAFASLVDLKTGNVVWFNHLSSSVGDIRTPEGASTMVSRLLTSMHEEPRARNKKKT
jgi:hypothetical protein